MHDANIAIVDNNVERFREILISGILNHRLKIYITNTIYHSSSEILKLILNYRHIDLNYTDEDGDSPLLYACKFNSVEIIKILLDNGAKYIITTDDSPLQIAVQNRNLDIVRYLLKRFPDLVTRDIYAFIHACKKGNMDMVKLFLACGVDVTTPFPAPIKSASHVAILNKKLEIYNLLKNIEDMKENTFSLFSTWIKSVECPTQREVDEFVTENYYKINLEYYSDCIRIYQLVISPESNINSNEESIDATGNILPNCAICWKIINTNIVDPENSLKSVTLKCGGIFHQNCIKDMDRCPICNLTL